MCGIRPATSAFPSACLHAPSSPSFHSFFVVAGPDLVVLVMIAGHISATTIRELWKNRFFTRRSWRTHGTPRASHQCWDREPHAA